LDRYGVISLWTSTEYTAKYDGRAAYAFLFNNDIKIETTLTEKQKKHVSETSMDNYFFDAVVYNDSTLESFKEKLISFTDDYLLI
jgi:hypothetical protein